MSTTTNPTVTLTRIIPSLLPTRRTSRGAISQYDPKERFALRYQAAVPWEAIHWTFFTVTVALVLGVVGAALWRNYYYEDTERLQWFDHTRFRRGRMLEEEIDEEMSLEEEGGSEIGSGKGRSRGGRNKGRRAKGRRGRALL
ncbi:hypothetical protein EDC01DRAFT_780224 [Geopyxis carbonaria]|nr:hypothetical protein EDC01DRAFT_780224 [Geopyxis carbonaria]